MTMHVQRAYLRALPYQDWKPDNTDTPAWKPPPQWPCAWIGPAQWPRPAVFAFRRRFQVETAITVRCHVTADERYILFLDGEVIGRGSERGDPQHWFYETYDVHLTAGEHILVAQVWALGKLAPWAQMTVAPGFLFSPEGQEAINLLGTGVAPWEIMSLPGYDFVDPLTQTGSDIGGGAGIIMDERSFAWGFEQGAGDDWLPATTFANGNNGFMLHALAPVHLLAPATLPPMRDVLVKGLRIRFVDDQIEQNWRTPPVSMSNDVPDEHAAWEDCLGAGLPLTVPAHTQRRVLIDLDTYRALYPELELSGGAGARLTLLWAEALFTHPNAKSHEKGHRDTIDGYSFIGIGDAFTADGGQHRRFAPLWWRAGRYAQLTVKTDAEPLTIHGLTLRETGYPLAITSQVEIPDRALQNLLDMCARTLQLCMHETFVDCPYYEQLMYSGDTRLYCLMTYLLSTDDRLIRKALRMFDAARLNYSGLPMGAHPSQQGGLIAPFALWWVAMVHDYALWRGDRAFIQSLLLGVRATLLRFFDYQTPTGLIASPPGWNFYDQAWPDDTPPGGKTGGISSLLNWHLVLALQKMVELEQWAGEPEFAQWAQRQAQAIAERATLVYWDNERHLLADDAEHQQYSEHTQCLAVLSGMLNPLHQEAIARQLRAGPAPDLRQPSAYFTHYLFETYQRLGMADLLPSRLGPWLALAERGLKTCPESMGDTRSDCHAWNAHPLYHTYATIVGIRPATLAFATVEIVPQLGALPWAKATLEHPRGTIAVQVVNEGQTLTGEVTLPPGLTGTFRYAGHTLPLREGTQAIRIPAQLSTEV